MYGKYKPLHTNLMLIQSTSLAFCVCAGWWSPTSCQRHRDTTLIGTLGVLVHHRQPLKCTAWPLKRRHFRTAVRCSPSLISCACSSGGKSGSGPDFQHKVIQPPSTQTLVISPFHTHLSNDERIDAFKPETVFSHHCQNEKTFKRYVKNRNKEVNLV